MQTFWIIFVLCMTFGWLASTWIRAKHGYPLEDHGGWWPGHEQRGSQQRVESLKAELAARDKAIADLEARVRVLERIATDRPQDLSDEIERLRA
jgi:hypothetical protein